MNSMFCFSRFSLGSRAILFSIVLGVSLRTQLPSYGQRLTSQDSPVVEIPQSRWYYRWGNSPEDDQGMPIWIYEDTSSSEWKPVSGSSDFRKNPQKQNFLWLMIKLPEGHWKYSAVLLSPISQSLEIYQNH